MISLVISMVSAYLIGSIPTSFIFTKLLKNVDIRTRGSGNVGASNVFRVVGRIPAVLVLILDMSKGILACGLLPYLFFNNTIGITMGMEIYRILLGICVIGGHVWSVFLKFRGGKGVATTAGVLVIIAPKVLAGALATWIIIFSIFRVVSVASIASAAFLPILGIVFQEHISHILFYVFCCLMGTYKHKDNIRRILRGEEKRLF